MSGQSKIMHTIEAVFASVLMSTIAVGAAVGPAQAVASPSQVALNA